MMVNARNACKQTKQITGERILECIQGIFIVFWKDNSDKPGLMIEFNYRDI